MTNLPTTSALYRALNPDHEWTLTNHLLAGIFDAQNLTVWLTAGGKKKDKPKPLERPGARTEKLQGAEQAAAALSSGADSQARVGDSLPADHLSAFLGLDDRFSTHLDNL